jgi:hypothetical protein
MEPERGYEEATRALSGYIVAGRAGQGTATLDHVGTVCSMLGIDLGRLSAIHVAGTKGKGSTSALAERLLRAAGVRTGLFTSPHLVDVRERVRINGCVLDKETFARYFWTVHDTVSVAVAEHSVHLHYFHFLTVLSFYIFQEQHVDVAVMEVGLGGRLDSTNVMPRPGHTRAAPLSARRRVPTLLSRVWCLLQSSAASPCWISTTWPFSETPSRSLPAKRLASSRRTCPWCQSQSSPRRR